MRARNLAPVTRLVLINGAPGSGKSTLARMCADEHPLVLALEIDTVRAMLGCWLNEPAEAGLVARRMVLEMAGCSSPPAGTSWSRSSSAGSTSCFSSSTAAPSSAPDFIGVALLSNHQDAADRFERRSRHPATATHRDAAALLDRSSGPAQLEAMYDRLLEVVASRPGTRTVITVHGEVEQAYRDLCSPDSHSVMRAAATQSIPAPIHTGA